MLQICITCFGDGLFGCFCNEAEYGSSLSPGRGARFWSAEFVAMHRILPFTIAATLPLATHVLAEEGETNQ